MAGLFRKAFPNRAAVYYSGRSPAINFSARVEHSPMPQRKRAKEMQKRADECPRILLPCVAFIPARRRSLTEPKAMTESLLGWEHNIGMERYCIVADVGLGL